MLAENHYRLGILFNLLLQFTKEKELLLSINILLENPVEAKYYFTQLTQTKQDTLKVWPIYNLYQKLTND